MDDDGIDDEDSIELRVVVGGIGGKGIDGGCGCCM